MTASRLHIRELFRWLKEERVKLPDTAPERASKTDD